MGVKYVCYGVGMTDLSESRRAGQHRDQPRTPRRRYDAAKRILDILVSLAAIVALAPLLAALWPLTLWTSPGPALFRQERLGRRMRPFIMLKLRTMYTGTSDQVHREYVAHLFASGDSRPVTGQRGLLKLEADPRITPVGAWLRRTSLDELPQLFNVLRGDMSLVGPRPVLRWEAEMWPASYPAYTRRFEVKPGMTGLWQVSGRGLLSVRESIDLDAEYVQRRSFMLDLAILARTLPSLLRGGAA
jgi:lipopolysaccharide/colanic/teichoic acid biosynthesis glycosyltransferase